MIPGMPIPPAPSSLRFPLMAIATAMGNPPPDTEKLATRQPIDLCDLINTTAATWSGFTKDPDRLEIINRKGIPYPQHRHRHR